MVKKRGKSRTTAKTTGGRTKRGGPGTVQVVVVDRGERVPHLPTTTPHASRSRAAADGRRRRSWVGQSPVVVSKLCWRYRWQLSPFAAAALVFVTTTGAPVWTLVMLLALAGLAYAASRTEVKVGGRKLLSKNERQVVAYWALGASASVVVELLSGGWAWQRATFTLVLGTSVPTFVWLRSRRPTRAKSRLSKDGKARVAQWARVSKYSEGVLKGSHVLPATAHEPSEGTVVFSAQLRADAHGENAENEIVWRAVEALLALPPKTVKIRCDTKNATRVAVTMSTSKHLEFNVVPWPGPELNARGDVVLGDTLAGAKVDVPRYDAKGVFHGRVSGNTGNGKSTTARVILTARASATATASPAAVPADVLPAYGSAPGVHEEVIWLLDGKRGTSVPEIANVFDWYATTDAEWPLVLDALYAVLLDRQLRRGRQKLSAWRPGKETDPIVTCYLAESSAVRRSLAARGLAKHYDKIVLELLQHGRALGVAVIQEAQDTIAENFLGGRQARELMSKGAAVMHRPGGATGAQFAADGAAERARLLKLPDVEGFAVVMVNGKLAADTMRVRWCSEEDSEAWADDYVPRTLDGADLRAAGSAYLKRTRGRDFADETADELPQAAGNDHDQTFTVPVPILDPTRARASARVEPVADGNGNGNGNGNGSEDVPLTAEEEHTTEEWVYKILMFNRGGLTVDELVERGGGKRGRSQTNVYRCLARLREAGRVYQDGTRYFGQKETS